MSSINNNKPVLSRSPSIQSLASTTPPESPAVLLGSSATSDIVASGRSDAALLQQLPPRPMPETPRSQSMTRTSSVSSTRGLSASNEAAPTEPQQDAINEASKKSLSELVRDVSVKTSSARAATKYTTVAGIGLAFGLLFAGQPIGVMFVIPAFAVLGTIIAYVMRAAHNAKLDPSIEAFKNKMSNLTEEDKRSPDLAEALQLNAFLTDSFTSFAKSQVKGLVGGFKNPLAGFSAKLAEAKAALEQQAAQGKEAAPSVAAQNEHSAPLVPAERENNVTDREVLTSESASNVGGPRGQAVQEGSENIEDTASELSFNDYETAASFSQRTTTA